MGGTQPSKGQQQQTTTTSSNNLVEEAAIQPAEEDTTMSSPSANCGHVFVLHCAVGGIAADAILLMNSQKGASTTLPAASEQSGSKAKYYEVGPSSGSADLLTLSKSFLEEVGTSFQGGKSVYRRGKPLLALEPSSFLAGASTDEEIGMMKSVVGMAYSTVDKYGVDVAICVTDADTYTSVVKLRKDECPFKGGPFWMLSEFQNERVSALAKVCENNRLAVFIGAGVSIPSGAPSWGGLLDELAIRANYSEEDRTLLQKLDYLDQPTILEEDLADGFKPAVADVLNESTRYTPAHALLKTLKCPAVTTNYDALFEQAASSGNETISCLPWDSRALIASDRDVQNCLLKLHGCVNHPESIVLTRKDYMRYPDNFQALRGRLQGIFLTNEVMFCGFSMTDDNVHKIIDDIRKVTYCPTTGKPLDSCKLGTILTMTENKMFDRLWDQDFHIQAFGKSWGDNPSWYHDCFLDALASTTTSTTSNVTVVE